MVENIRNTVEKVQFNNKREPGENAKNKVIKLKENQNITEISQYLDLIRRKMKEDDFYCY